MANLAKTYQPQDYEANIYALWEASGAFKPTGKGDPYSIIMPPPNANGNLHIGHALFVALEDILIRYHRMRGYDTVWLPGEDHAGFETWVVFERQLEKEGKSRFDFSRDELYKMTHDFVDQSRGRMNLQLRALGASCDWDKLTFTLDPKVTDVVFTTFKKLWDDGLIYRGERIVNYCTKHDTSFADIEVEYEEEQGSLWFIDYPLSDGSGKITVATTRPETMLGDEAVAVHPEDPRYKDMIGKTLTLPIVGKKIPVVADTEVEREFGTGAVKITPAHDPLDFEIGQRHNLPVTAVIGFDGKMTDKAPADYRGLTIKEAREKVVEELEKSGVLVKTEDFTHQVPHCYKCGSVIEPLAKEQWFISVKPLTKAAIKAVKDGKIKFTPKSKAKELINYYKELRDWNISRQIPWGIPIPAFQNIDDPSDWIFDRRVSEKEIVVDGKTYRRDEDTFDTWFSSGQWPYVLTRGDLTRFYPSAVMETGSDILRQWVARMVMLGLYIAGDVPFKEVYLHGLVNDAHNQKMSKSKGNVINPMDVIDEYGSDAMRLGIIANRSAAQAQAFSPATVVAGRNLCNKLWNMARFIESSSVDTSFLEPQSLADHWVLRQLDNARQDIEQLLKDYRFSEAYETLYHAIWDDVADWYLEASKQSERNLLGRVLDYILKLAHPFAPFVTEAIWQASHDEADGLLITQEWPGALEYNAVQAAEFDRVRSLVGEVRYLLAELGGQNRTLYFKNDDLIEQNADIIKHLTRVAKVEQSEAASGIRVASENREAWLSATEDELNKHYEILENRLADTKAQILKLEQRLGNKNYVANAPAELVQESREELADKQALAERLRAELELSN